MGVCYNWDAADGLESNGRSDIEMVQEPEVGCDAMGNPLVHMLVLIAAVIIPGGLLVYFGYWARQKCKAAEKKAAEERARDPIEEIRGAFLEMYPIESLRAKERRQRLERARRHRRSNPSK